MLKRKIALLLVMLTLFGCATCDNSNNDDGSIEIAYGNLDEATMWGVPSTVKVLQDVLDGYDDVKTEAILNLYSAKGESESQQIIITAQEKRLVYTLELSDLSSSSGTKFSKENIEVFHEKYLSLTTDFDKTGNPLGNYPDALVPYENIVSVGENIVEPNQNQGLYFRFNVPVDQEAGVYTGSVKLTIGDKSQEIPISLEVRNLVVSQVNHAKSHYLTAWFYERGELDTTQEMLNKYNDFLYEYRICGSELIDDTSHSTAEIKAYVDLAYEKMQNPKCSTVSIPGKQANEGWGFHGPTLMAYLRAFVKKSLETNYNMMDKLIFYENYVDEPQHWGPDGVTATKEMSNRYKECISKVAKEFEEDWSITSPIKDEVIKSLKKVPNIITARYDEVYAPYVDTWCPTYNYYDTEYSRNLYAEQEEKWWYGCIDPHPPYPSYHIEDTLLASRLEPWMKADYGVVGTLNWAVDVYAECVGTQYIDIEDYYSGSASRYPAVNGDGWLLYPGKAYGVDGPIPSIRLDAIRDGLEEYELLYEISENYKKVSAELSAIDEGKAFTSDKIIDSITSSIYVGTRVLTNNNSFHEARNALYALAELSQNTGVCITNFEDNSYGQYVFTLVAPKGVKIKQNGVVATPKESIADYDEYALTCELTSASNYFNIVVETEEGVCEYKQFLGGKAAVNKVENANVKEFGKETVTPTCTLIDANKIDSSLSGKMMKIDVPSVGKGKEQAFTVKGSLLNGIGESASKLIFHVYYTGDDDVQFVISAKYKNVMVYYDLATLNLQQGMNTIEINLTDKEWATLGGIEYLSIYLGGQEGEPERTVYIIDSVVYDK